MHDIAAARASFVEQAVIFQRKHNWIMCWLYTGTFGSFIGYSAGFPLLAKTQFPDVNALAYAFLGPLVGALSRSLSGWVSDRWGGGRVTFWVFVAMAVGVVGVLYFLAGAAWSSFLRHVPLPVLRSGCRQRVNLPDDPVDHAHRDGTPDAGRRHCRTHAAAEMEGAAIIGFTSAVAAYGAFFIPKSYGTSISLTGGSQAALWAFLIFYLSCIAVTWWFYTRRGGLLRTSSAARIDKPVRPPIAQPA